MKNLLFKNGDQLPIVGLGTWKSKPGEVRQAVYWAIEAGYRHLDCAAIYQNENEVGQGITDALADGLVKRKDLFITSKLWNDSHRHEDVRPALETSLNKLRLDYLDLYLIHWPIAFKPGVGFAKNREDYFTYQDVPLTQTWEAMQEQKESGLAHHIGVSNFNEDKLKLILAMDGDKPEMNQIELHPFLPQEKLVNFCAENGILLTAYSPLGSPDSRAERHNNDPRLLENPVVIEIAKKHGVGAGEVLIAYSVARDIAVIPKSINKERIISNFKAADLPLDSQDIKQLREIGVSHRFIDGSFFTGPQSPYKISDLFQ
ncbi:alcohol dehydrogenase (NADP+) [Algoriphagus boseongensis]|uniref:Alcohol dehydrogenase (NADP+) n=1 Tax=Algoriphagus boseongensis TaxID=1442587 RepID=A0A4R6T6K1_9BACT|nr:aldo/keto reductase [Algoriphagus boseongensis]TDQ18778.1 alcohol dehydrogenase (NADP+) [Algoriphagus boseongensis]